MIKKLKKKRWKWRFPNRIMMVSGMILNPKSK